MYLVQAHNFLLYIVLYTNTIIYHAGIFHLTFAMPMYILLLARKHIMDRLRNGPVYSKYNRLLTCSWYP